MLDINIGIAHLSDPVLTGLETEDPVFFGHAGAHFALNPTFSFRLQLADHSSNYTDTDLNSLVSALILIFGGSINTGMCSALIAEYIQRKKK